MIKKLLEKLKANYPHYVIDNQAYRKLCKETDDLFEEFFGLADVNAPKKDVKLYCKNPNCFTHYLANHKIKECNSADKV